MKSLQPTKELPMAVFIFHVPGVPTLRLYIMRSTKAMEMEQILISEQNGATSYRASMITTSARC